MKHEIGEKERRTWFWFSSLTLLSRIWRRSSRSRSSCWRCLYVASTWRKWSSAASSSGLQRGGNKDTPLCSAIVCVEYKYDYEYSRTRRRQAERKLRGGGGGCGCADEDDVHPVGAVVQERLCLLAQLVYTHTHTHMRSSRANADNGAAEAASTRATCASSEYEY